MLALAFPRCSGCCSSVAFIANADLECGAANSRAAAMPVCEAVRRALIHFGGGARGAMETGFC